METTRTDQSLTGLLSGNRRAFLRATGTAFAALAASGCAARGGSLASAATAAGYGPLQPDPAGVLDLPIGFSYRVISRMGDAMSDGGTVPDRGDGMGCFALPGGKIALVRNHELQPQHDAGGTVSAGYDVQDGKAGAYLPGGTTTIVLDARTLAVENQFRSLAGTIRNCAGGETPWGTWLSCEEDVSKAGGRLGKKHGYVFEVPANGTGAVNPVPLTAMGRFNHEAAAVDPATGIIYETEDREDSLLYRFIPKVPGKLAQGGKLQALVLEGITDTRNWTGANMSTGAWHAARWVDIDNPDSDEDDLRKQGAAKGATLFARGEGIWMGEGELYFCCTSGGAAKLGQIFSLKPMAGGPDMLQLFFESTSIDQFNYGDNLCVAPNGHLVVCEDQYTDAVDNHLRGITPTGAPYTLGRLRMQTELAGACFSPDGKTLFVNAYGPTTTFAITGPWIS